MDAVNRKLKEASRALWGVQVNRIFLDTIIFFLVVAIPFSILGLSLLIDIILSMAWMLALVVVELARRNVMGRVSAEYPTLSEPLATAVDNDDKDNIILQNLMANVSKRMENVESSSFVDTGRLMIRVVSIVFLIFLILIVTVIDFREIAVDVFGLDDSTLDKLSDRINEYGTDFQVAFGKDRWEANPNYTTNQEDDKLGAESGGERPGYNEGEIQGTGGGVGGRENEEIYAQASSANIEGREIEFKLHPEYGGNIDIEEADNNAKKVDYTPELIESVGACDECVVGPEHEEIVRKYFEKLLEDTR